VDEGISGSKEHRPALDRLIAACQKRFVDAVVVYRYERFAADCR
jgi:DNA invertase Pin-like site-specific DNA recombinase